MSSIKTTQIDGDVSVGRNVSIGGNTTIQGNGYIKGGFKVDGWLEAKNIKGANKGIFTTVEKLREAYPLPHDGWWAVVGRSLPSPIYVADGGAWVATGESGGNPTVDSEQYNNNIAKLLADIKGAKSDISENSTKIKALEEQGTTQRDSVNQTREAVVKAQQTADEAKRTADGLTQQKALPDGIAPLDSEGKIPASHLPSYVDDVIEFDSTVSGITAQQQPSVKRSTDANCKVVYDRDNNVFVLAVTSEEETPSTTYYSKWIDSETFGAVSINGRIPVSGKVYIDNSDNITYRWSGTKLAPIGSDLALGHTSATAFPGNEGKQLQDNMTDVNKRVSTLESSNSNTATQIKARGVINVNKLLGQENGDMTFSVALSKIDELPNKADYQIAGIVLTFNTPNNGWQSKQWVNTETWNKEGNWKDFGANGSNIGNILNVNTICPDVEYTLSTAIKAVQDLEEQSGFKYFKSGVVLTFKTADNDSNGAPVWATFQFTREVPDINPADTKPWVAFGGGGTAKVEVSDTPEQNGEKAFSTGGAYSKIPTNIKLNTETEGVVKLQLVNEANEGVGDEQQFTVGTSGNTSGTTIAIAFKENPLYVKAGGSVIMEASVRSVQMQGNKEVTNNIERLELIDRDTKQVLETLNVNKASSADAETFDFQIDVSAYFTKAGARRFQLVAYDDSEHSGSKNTNVNAVDVTIESVQTLNYTANTVLNAGGGVKFLQMYKFANNASDKGILATTEIFLSGRWQKLGEATVLDTYSHPVSFNPNDVLGGGEVLTHGAYPIRIHGEDIGSRKNGVVGTGVIGNYLHTAVMVIEEGNKTPIVATRWYSEGEEGTKKLYETISVDYAVYDSQSSEPVAEVFINDDREAQRVAYRSQTYTFMKKVTNVNIDGSVTLGVVVKSGKGASQKASFRVSGTMLAIEEVKTQRQFSIDFAGRSNTESDHTISDTGVILDVEGVNWSTNGFVTDNFGTSAIEGNMSLRIAENATGKLHYSPFNDAAMEQNGMAIQFTVMKKNIANDDARLISCLKNGFGFWVDGKNVVFTFDGGKTVAHTITAALDDGERTNIAIVIEPSTVAPYPGIGVAKMYFDGEEIGACYYTAGSLIAHDAEVAFDGTLGDLYLYNVKAWRTYFGFEQEFNNYLLTMVDTDAMITEYGFNDVMASVTAENTTKNRPQAKKLYDIGIPYFVLCKNKDTADNEAKDNYPEYLEGLDGDKKTKRTYDVYAYFPNRPWQDFKAVGVKVTNQGTTSSKRPIKNIKMKFKGAVITLLHTAEEFSGKELEKYNDCLANAGKRKVQVLDTSLPTNIITVKVDYSESGGANNGASTNLYNDLQRELGANYITPAQMAYNGTTRYTINSSICSIPCAFFRTDRFSPDATSPSYGYFHAKGNWNEDKGDAKIYGFEGVAGYNKKCLNYGDFYELVAAKNQSLDDFVRAQDKSQWVFYSDEKKAITFDVVVVSEFCGPRHRVFRRQEGGDWKETTGTMSFDGSKWVVSGDVVNPVENYELLKYDALDWFQGVNTVEDMLTPDTEGKPIWLQYFESRYPDDDALNALYEAGKKVPYQLYRWLRFCQDCNQHLTEENGTITIGGVSTSGTKANRLKKWKQELHTVANVYSVLCYHIFTDYIAAVDQRSKNMMVGFYLDRDGVVRMYLNHLYDGDTILGSDNDCGLTIPALLDPNNDDAGVYQGHDSVLFVQNAAVGNDGFWLDDEGQKTVTMRAVAQTMRKLTTADGLVPFSYSGLVKYWITDRLTKWPKVVSSFDGERKYIEHSKATANYFYALHGLSIQRLKDFIKTRFLFRDGFYQTGDLYSSVVSMRATGKLVNVRIRAAKDGYFGIGVDRANVATDSCYLKAGQTYTLQSGMTNTGSGTMLYVFGADKLELLDISGCTPSPASWDISALTLVKELIIGGANYRLQNNNEGYLTNLTLGNLPFLEVLDVRNTAITTIDARYCPRLKKVQATGSQLTKINVAEAGAIETLEVPAIYKTLALRYLPKLANSGIVLESAGSVETLIVEGCDKIDQWALLMKCAGAIKSSLKYVRITDIKAVGNGSELETLKSLNLQGIDATLSVSPQPVLTGTYRLTKYTDDDTLEGWRRALPLLTIKQQPYSDYKELDNVEDTENITNMDNSTGYAFNNDYVASGHILKIRKKSVPVKGQLNKGNGKMHLTKLSETDYTKFADGSAFDNKDLLGEQYDCFMFIPHFWYKGINDFKAQEKHTLLSSNREEPEATFTKKNQPLLSECLFVDAKGVISDKANVGMQFGDECMGDLVSCAVYRLDVEGMKQARYIGLNNATYCAVFVDGRGRIIEKQVLAITSISGSPLDFKNENGDYVYNAVPSGAKYLYFTCFRALSDDEHIVLSVDSEDIEAIEPGWVEHKAELIGIYGGTTDDFGLFRSVSGKRTRRGNQTNKTSEEWIYDKEGNPTNMPVGSLNYSFQDLLNLCRYRGKGYHSISYEQSKIIAILSRCYYGNRDDQRIYGFGCSSDYITGSQDAIGKADTVYGSANKVPNKIWGLEGFVGCVWEMMDNVGVNISTFAAWKAAKRPDDDESMPVDAKWHIYDDRTKSERIVQGIASDGYNIARLKHGRFCDVIGSSFSIGEGAFSTGYAACQRYSPSRGRYVGRAYTGADERGGLVGANASRDDSYWYSYWGARLAFDGELENESEIDSEE